MQTRASRYYITHLVYSFTIYFHFVIKADKNKYIDYLTNNCYLASQKPGRCLNQGVKNIK